MRSGGTAYTSSTWIDSVVIGPIIHPKSRWDKVRSMSPLLTYSATRLARMIRERDVTSEAVVLAHIERVRRVNGRLNAVVKDRFAEAREEARRADQAVRDGRPLGRFHGVPCSIKESFALTGM